MTLELQEIVRATGAELVRCGSSAAVESVSVDSRRLDSGALFVALKGPRFDGHDFLSEAVSKGATALLVTEPGKAERLLQADVTILVVKDPLRALGDLARYVRCRNSPLVVAVTGSNGKTTTKEMIAEILVAEHGPAWVLKNAGNENNLVGVPLTLLRLSGEGVAVVELGTSAPGEIARLAEIADPDVGVITNIGPAHLEGLGSIEGVARAKGELLGSMRADMTAVLNADDERVRALAKLFRGKVIYFGDGGEVRARGGGSSRGEGWQTAFELIAGPAALPVKINYLGRHNISNALAAAAAAVAAGVRADAIRAGLENAKPVPMRMQVLSLPGGASLISDCYNANPASVMAALGTLREMAAVKRWVVLGDMCELGERSGALHHEIGLVAGGLGLWRLYLMGDHAEDTARGARQSGLDRSRIRIADSHETIAKDIEAGVGPGDWILVKGSRALRMELVVERLRRGKG